jgi:hypothetical protein
LAEEGEVVRLCRRAIASARALAASYDDIERRLADAGAELAATDVAALLDGLMAAERELEPLLRPVAELRARSRASLAPDARALVAEIDALAPELARRHDAVLHAAVAARDLCAERLVGLVRARATRAGYASPRDGAPRLASKVA